MLIFFLCMQSLPQAMNVSGDLQAGGGEAAE
jgi:hypothetical protein